MISVQQGDQSIGTAHGRQFRRRLWFYRRIAQSVEAFDADEGEEYLAVKGSRDIVDIPFF